MNLWVVLVILVLLWWMYGRWIVVYYRFTSSYQIGDVILAPFPKPRWCKIQKITWRFVTCCDMTYLHTGVIERTYTIPIELFL